jgi:hypothetical protein
VLGGRRVEPSGGPAALHAVTSESLSLPASGLGSIVLIAKPSVVAGSAYHQLTLRHA